MLPDNAVTKALHNPQKILPYLRNQILLQIRDTIAVQRDAVHTKLRAQYLFDHSWDVAVILDACRYDTASAIAIARSEWSDPQAIYSAGAHSKPWTRRTFARVADDELARTAVITANPYSTLIDTDALQSVDEVWRYAVDSEYGVVPPRPVNDRAITAIRGGEADRYVIHYMQPHLPPLTEPPGWVTPFDPDEQVWAGENPWKLVENGKIEGDRVKAAYRENLDHVLDDVELLRSNVDAETMVVTADHGNYLGESGRWGHYDPYMVETPVRRVPWWETQAVDTGEYHPSEYDRTTTAVDREEQLRALGYR